MVISPLAKFVNTPENYRLLLNYAVAHESLDNAGQSKKMDLTVFEKQLGNEIDKTIKKTLDKVFK